MTFFYFKFESGTYQVILEVDEKHHKHQTECDVARMNNIIMSLGLPVKFIRYNPENKKVTDTIKHQTLIKVLNEELNREFMENLDPIYLF